MQHTSLKKNESEEKNFGLFYNMSIDSPLE